MNVGVVYNKSAFKHGLTEADIEWAFLHPIRNEEQVNVFHAMKCRKGFLQNDMQNLV